jgi:hypothetical protein
VNQLIKSPSDLIQRIRIRIAEKGHASQGYERAEQRHNGPRNDCKSKTPSPAAEFAKSPTSLNKQEQAGEFRSRPNTRQKAAVENKHACHEDLWQEE